jgi:putative cell wall-binding protein
LQLGHAPADTPSMLRRSLPLLLAALGVLGVVRPVPVVAAPGPQEYPVHAVGLVPDDPYYPDQWGPKKIGMEDAWAETTGASSTVIAVIDTGVDPTYPDLAGKVLPGWDFVDNDADAFDEHGHGSFVALVAAGIGNDGTAMAGHCWQCKILPVRVLDENGNGDTGGVASGIVWAADHGADVINLSLAGSSSSSTLDAAIRHAWSLGVLVVAAAGNFVSSGATPDLTAPQYPAATPGVISVGATGPTDSYYWWSFRGSWVNVTAPGCIFDDNSLCGTSFASPAVAGILALALALVPGAEMNVLTNALYTSVAPVTGGAALHGRVNAASFLSMIQADVQATRVSGPTRIATAIAVSQRTYPAGTGTIVLARSDNYADALAAAPLAAQRNAPVLLTPGSSLEGSVEAEIARLGATTAVLAGGTAALSTSIESRLHALGIATERYAGRDRYDTAGLIGRQVDGSTAYVVSASGFADAVAVSGLAALTHGPILLVEGGWVPEPTRTALAAIAPSAVVVIGGTAVISEAVRQELGASRIAGANRYETSALVAQSSLTKGANRGRVWTATGTNWPDALSAGPAAAAAGAVLVLADPAAGSVRDWVSGVPKNQMSEVVVVGGPVTLSDPAMYSVQALLN